MNHRFFKPHKYKAKPTEVDGIKFPSKAEAQRYRNLCLLKRDGQVIQFLRQVPFYLPGNSKYVVDFQVFWADGNVTFEDVKGIETEVFKLKKRQVEELYAPIKITVLTAKEV